MNITDYIWFQVIKVVLPVVCNVLPKDSQKSILQELWAWQEVLKFRRKDYSRQIEIANLLSKLERK